MKAMKWILTLVCVTIFVACGKDSKQGNGGDNRRATTPNSPYTNNNVGGYGYQLPGCRGQIPMFSSLYQFCGWLANNNSSSCSSQIRRQNFAMYCMQFSQQLNFATDLYYQNPNIYTGGVGASVHAGYWYTCWSSSSRSGKVSSSGSSTGSSTTRQKSSTRPTPKTTQDEVTSTTPAQNVRELDMNKCRKIKITYSQRLGKFSKYFDSKEDALKQAQNRNVECYENGQWSPFYKEEQVAVAPTPVPTTTSASTTVGLNDGIQGPLVPSSEGISVEDLPLDAPPPRVDLSQCFNMENIHNHIKTAANNLSSYSQDYQMSILAPQKEISLSYKKSFEKDFYAADGSFRSVVKPDGTISAIADVVKQSGAQLTVDSLQGQIVACNNQRVMVVETELNDEKQIVTYTWNGLMDQDGEIHEKREGAYTSGKETHAYLVARYMYWSKGLEIKQLQKQFEQNLNEFNPKAKSAIKETLNLLRDTQ